MIGGWLAYPDDVTMPTGLITLQVAIPVVAVLVALYGVWSFRSKHVN